MSCWVICLACYMVKSDVHFIICIIFGLVVLTILLMFFFIISSIIIITVIIIVIYDVRYFLCKRIIVDIIFMAFSYCLSIIIIISFSNFVAL